MKFRIQSYPPPQGTSISDSVAHIGFLQLCNLAVEEEAVFKHFRSNANFVEILEHVDYWRGHQYAGKIRKYRFDVKKFVNLITNFDSVGMPLIYKYRSIPKCSPTLLRYISVYFELKEYFGKISDIKITEIGVGYGGQASVIKYFEKPSEYNLYDLPEVLGLAEKFLSMQEIGQNFSTFDGRNPDKIKSDLVISNYAFSEINGALQKQYLNNILLEAKMGYITWNNLAANNLSGMSVEQILAAIPGSEVLPEIPTTAPGNLVIVWGHKV